MIRRRVAALALLVVFAACGKTTEHPDSWAVGTYVGGGSWLAGPRSCTYDAPASVAELSTDTKGAKFMAKLVGEGSITETCDNQKIVHAVKRATALHIGGPASIKVGAIESTIERFVVVPLAGTERLRGAYQGGVAPSWSLAPDCDGVAEFAPVLGSSDTGGADITRSLRPIKPGTCTINASVLGLETAKPVTIK